MPDGPAAAGAPVDRHRRRRREEAALERTVDYVTERKAFGKPIAEFQNTRFKLAELQDRGAGRPRVFLDQCLELHLRGELDAATAAMAK